MNKQNRSWNEISPGASTIAVSAKQRRYIAFLASTLGQSPVKVTAAMTRLEASWLIQSLRQLLDGKKKFESVR